MEFRRLLWLDTMKDLGSIVQEQLAFSSSHHSSGSPWSSLPIEERLLSLYGEVGELSDLFKKSRRGDCSILDVKHDIACELADCLIYLALIAGELGIDFDLAYESKMSLNRERYREYEIS